MNKKEMIGVKTPFQEMTLATLGEWLDHAKATFHAGRLFHAFYRDGLRDPHSLYGLPKAIAHRVTDSFTFEPQLTIVSRVTSYDHATKYLLRLHDGKTVEAVAMPYDDRLTICLSTQVGCAIACRFCETGKMGFTRNLSTSEMVDQILLIQEDFPEKRVSNLVMMGMGEPLANLDNTLRFIDIVRTDHGFNIGATRITVSTAGLAPGIRRLGREAGVSLALSLHAPNDALRTSIMPINKAYPLAEVMSACRDYPLKRSQSILIEYTLMAGVNDSRQCAEELAELLRSLPRVKVNLIPYNPGLGSSEFQTPPRADMEAFQRILIANGYLTTIRFSRGQDVAGACGQLANRGDRLAS